MPKPSSLNHLGQHIKPLLGGFHTLLVSIYATCMYAKSSSMNHLGQHIKHPLSGFHILVVSIFVTLCMPKFS